MKKLLLATLCLASISCYAINPKYDENMISQNGESGKFTQNLSKNVTVLDSKSGFTKNIPHDFSNSIAESKKYNGPVTIKCEVEILSASKFPVGENFLLISNHKSYGRWGVEYDVLVEVGYWLCITPAHDRSKQDCFYKIEHQAIPANSDYTDIARAEFVTNMENKGQYLVQASTEIKTKNGMPITFSDYKLMWVEVI